MSQRSASKSQKEEGDDDVKIEYLKKSIESEDEGEVNK